MLHPAQLDRFKIIRQIGAGGMGTVYEAVDPEIERRVAIKVLRHDLLEQNPELLQRLFVEARAANAIGHPGVVQISEARRLADGTGFLVMELLHGQTLTQLMQQNGGRLRVEVAVQLAIQIASTLRAGHQQGVIHRDLKPDNIMLVADDAVQGGERVKLLDFGIAKMAQVSASAVSLTLADMGLGTPGYMAPEQMRDAAAASARSDVYGLGAVLFEALSGRRPHVADTQVDLMVAVLSTDAPLLKDLVPELPQSLSELVAQMLHRTLSEARPDMVEVLRRLYMVNIELSGQSRTGSPAGSDPARTVTPPTLLPVRMAVTSGHADSIPSGPQVGAVGAPASLASSSTPSQMRGQRVPQPHSWRFAVLSSVVAAVLMLLVLRRNQPASPPPVPVDTTIGRPAIPAPVVTPPPTVTPPLDDTVPAVAPPVVKKPGAPKLKPTGKATAPDHPAAASGNYAPCEARPPRTITPADAAIVRAVQGAISAYHLRLCKNESLVIRINSGDGSLSVTPSSPGMRGRSSFDTNGFMLRIQGTLATNGLQSYRQITIAY